MSTVPYTTVAVAPTPTELFVLDTRGMRATAVQVDNLDPVQTIACTVFSRVDGRMEWAPSSLPDLSSIPALESRLVQIDTSHLTDLRITAVASGAGCDVAVTAVGV